MAAPAGGPASACCRGPWGAGASPLPCADAHTGAPCGISSRRNGGKEGPGGFAHPGPPNTGAHGGGALCLVCKDQPRIAARFPGCVGKGVAAPRAARIGITPQALMIVALYRLGPPGRHRCHAAEIPWCLWRLGNGAPGSSRPTQGRAYVCARLERRPRYEVRGRRRNVSCRTAWGVHPIGGSRSSPLLVVSRGGCRAGEIEIPRPALSFPPLSFGKKVGPPEAGPPLGGRMISAPTGMAVDTRAGVVARHRPVVPRRTHT